MELGPRRRGPLGLPDNSTLGPSSAVLCGEEAKSLPWRRPKVFHGLWDDDGFHVQMFRVCMKLLKFFWTGSLALRFRITNLARTGT